MSIGISFDSRPPWALRRLGFKCLYTRLTPSTTILPSVGSTRSTRAVVPRSSPVMTCTVSSLRMFMLNHLGRQADDLHEVALAQLAGDGAEDAGAARVHLVVDEHQRVAIEAHVAAVVAARRLLRADHDALDHVARLHVAAGDGLLDAGDDDVAQPGVAPAAAAEHLDAHALFGAGVIRHVQVRILLNHDKPSGRPDPARLPDPSSNP